MYSQQPYSGIAEVKAAATTTQEEVVVQQVQALTLLPGPMADQVFPTRYWGQTTSGEVEVAVLDTR